jgi:hypothetical protein
MDHHTRMLNAAEALADAPDGFSAGYLEYQARTTYRDLCRVYGYEGARAIIAEIILSESSRKRITIDG